VATRQTSTVGLSVFLRLVLSLSKEAQSTALIVNLTLRSLSAMRYMFGLLIWLAIGVYAVTLGGVEPDSFWWWLLFGTPGALLGALLLIGLPVILVMFGLSWLQKWR
jgi:hypothetical protein